MPQYKLYYFNARGRAEPARLCFAAAGVQYEDVRLEYAEWVEKKKDESFSPLGYLPMLEVDGKKLNESMAIMRYVARECGLCPSDSFETAQCDMIIDSLYDLYVKMYAFMFEKDEGKKKSDKEEFFSTRLPNHLTKMTALLKANNGGQGFIVGSKLSYADISIFILGDTMCRLDSSCLDAYPEIKALCHRVGESDGIREWIKIRPDTKL